MGVAITGPSGEEKDALLVPLSIEERTAAASSECVISENSKYQGRPPIVVRISGKGGSSFV